MSVLNLKNNLLERNIHYKRKYQQISVQVGALNITSVWMDSVVICSYSLEYSYENSKCFTSELSTTPIIISGLYFLDWNFFFMDRNFYMKKWLPPNQKILACLSYELNFADTTAVFLSQTILPTNFLVVSFLSFWILSFTDHFSSFFSLQNCFFKIYHKYKYVLNFGLIPLVLHTILLIHIYGT